MTSLLEQVTYRSESMQHLRNEMGPFLKSSASMLFWGEPGSGMGFLARAIHEASGRPGRLLIIPGFSLEADSVKQQFLGVGDCPGWLEKADKGTIFVKRISETVFDVHQTLQRLLANRSLDGRLQFTRKGAADPIEVNVRFLFSMTHDLNMALQDELIHRQTVEEMKRRGDKIIRMPALRERKEDLLVLAQHFIDSANQKFGRSISGISESAQTLLLNYIWPGNIEELKQLIESIASQYSDLTEITEQELPEQIVNPEISGDKYRFKFKDDSKFVGKILSPVLHIHTEKKKLRLKAWNIVEIIRIEDDSFAPPKFRHFLIRIKDGSQIAAQILDTRLDVETSFDACYQVNPQEIVSIYMA
ncbi:hypothetical protein CSB45_13245 [candidate division KSB3 bacterium]|uniref:Sigma-54 factor interaction domain-containing protein n=1 Tax=candidate division KSB3 bacterium TaxID=2044937 RepID=A0A2G6E2U5_9BACT|nr:MAG: hypothetical protein CSB45_13245 [candidate division KSB3 bacterium]PIE28662.1 MAG: hypothetical protein CSA57_12900 [candidate division KSB3 bacterium]